MTAEQTYNSLLKSGDLLEMYPGFSGTWAKDKKMFIQIFEEQQKIINDFSE